ncbi:MAG TPA: NUDIX hydrolase [Haliangiales bacterium]|nr:NUDIX hydrolase [Haliangiales bacterium]
MPIPAASVILVRERAAGGIEAFMVRRHRASSFMSNAMVFPGGKVDPGETAEGAAVRELFEEAGVLLVREPPDARWVDARRRLVGGETTFAGVLAELGVTLAPELLHPWSRWITPSAEPKRFDARFYVALLPPGQVPSYDRKETVEEMWVAPEEALSIHASGAARLPPPQLRTFWELARYGDVASLVAAAPARRVFPILPRFGETAEGGVALFLPWDAEYMTRGTGEAAEVVAGVPGPSRFLIEGMSWRME